MGYRIGSFNMKNLSLAALGKNGRDMEKIADIIRNEEFDIVAMQEILSEGRALVGDSVFKSPLLYYLGNDWDVTCDLAECANGQRGECYAFVWNKKRFAFSTVMLSNGTKRTYRPRIYKKNRQDMIRRPYYARFTPSGINGGPFFEIRLICTHIYYGSSRSEDIGIRNNEFRILTGEIYADVADRVYGNNMPSYTLILGDYNMNLPRSYNSSPFLQEVIEITDNGNVKSIRTVQDQKTTLKMKEFDSDELSEDDERGYSNNYDHFSFDENRFEGVGLKYRKIDAVRKYCGDDFARYRKEISDHVPIMMDINLKGDA